MNKALRVFIFSIIFIVVGYTTYFIFDWVKYGYQIEIKNYKPYFWIFKENVKKDVDTTFHVAFIRKTDILNAYRYKDQYEIFIWDFKDLKTINLKNIAINQNVDLGNIKFKAYQVLNKSNYPEIIVNFGTFFNSTINVNFDKYSTISEQSEGKNYRRFCGVFHKMSLSNKDAKHMVKIDYYDQTRYFTGILYNGHGSLFLILITSKESFNESIINILNLY